jgi:hypothetical protein
MAADLDAQSRFLSCASDLCALDILDPNHTASADELVVLA